MPARRIDWLLPVLLLSVLLLAAGLRFWRLGQLPPGFYHDEAYYGLDALSLLRGELFPRFYEGWELYANDAHAGRPPTPQRFPVFFEGNYGREPIHVYLAALSIRLFGATPWAVRAVTAAAGTLAVLTTWLAARALFPPDASRPFRGELLPLAAAFTLAVLYPALHFSRFGIRAMTLLPPLTLAVFTFWRGWRGRNAAWLGAAGFFTGLGLYTFASSRLFPLVFILFGVYLLLTDREALRVRWRGLALATGVAVLTAAPLLLFFTRYPYFFAFRMAYVANRGKGVVEGAPALTWLLNVGRVLGGLVWRGETHLRHNLPGRPYLDPAQAGLALLGVWRAGRFWRRPEYAFLLLWAGVMLLPSILSGDAPHFGRLTGVAPALAILVAVGLTWLAERLSAVAPGRWIAPVVVVGLYAMSLFFTARDYFGRYAAHPDLARDFYQADWSLGRFGAGLPPETTLYLSPSQEEMATIYFALGDPDRIRSFNGAGGLVVAGIPGWPSAYLVRSSEGETLANLRAYFPEGVAQAPQDGFVPFLVPAGAERVRTEATADADFGGVIRLVGYSVERVEDGVDVVLAWQAAAESPVGYTAFVHLIDGEGQVAAQSDRPPDGYPTSDWRAGEIVVDRFRVELPDGMSAGTYRLSTGFYNPADVVRLGEAADLGTIELP